MKHNLLTVKNTLGCQTLYKYKSASIALLSIMLACSLTACGGSGTGTDEETVTIQENSIPVANAGADQTVFVGGAVTLSGAESTDADGDTLSYSWSLSTIPTGSSAELSDTSNVAPSFSVDVAGTYEAFLTVNDGTDDSETDSVVITVKEKIASITGGVLCDYSYDAYNDSDSVQLDSTVTWNCTDEAREITANGVPDHVVGTFPNDGNPNTITAQAVTDDFTLAPTQTDIATNLGGPTVTGYVLNGVKIDANTAGSCDDSGNCSAIGNVGDWHIEALGHNSFDFGADENNAHVQPGGAYHYHGMPEGFVTKQGGDNTKMTIIGWAADGFPIYARYGYTIASDADSVIKAMTGSYQLKADVPDNRPSTETYTLGTFAEDWEYVANSGDLDECNGRFGVTPEFPEGIYHYYATDTYPYFQRCVKGEVEGGDGMPPPPPQ